MHRGEQTELYANAVTDWRLGEDEEAVKRSSFLQKLYWDARPVEYLLPYTISIFASISICLFANYRGLDWGWLQFVAGAFFAFNFGFAIAIGTTALKRYFHLQGDIRGFSVVILLGDAAFQVVLFDAVFVSAPVFGFAWGYSIGLAGFITLAGLVILHAPLYIRRAAAHAFFLSGMVMAVYGLPQVNGMEWFPYLILYKYISCHMPREEPYRPTSA